MQSVLEMPNDPIAQLQSMILKDVKKDYIQRKDLAILNVIADLPTDRPLIVEEADAFRNHLRLRLDVVLQ
jgi:hypothetical protein